MKNSFVKHLEIILGLIKYELFKDESHRNNLRINSLVDEVLHN